VLRPFSFDDMLYVGRPIDDMSLSYADVIRELAMVRDGVMAFTDYCRCMFFYCLSV